MISFGLRPPYPTQALSRHARPCAGHPPLSLAIRQIADGRNKSGHSDGSIGREALEAISDDEEAAAAIGVDVTREKLRVTVISAALTSLGGAVFGQYLMYLNPETVSGIGVSLRIVFAAIAGGMYAMLGPTVGALWTIALTEGLRVWFDANFVGAANTIYGILLILFVVFMPRGILGWLEAARRPRAAATSPAEQRVWDIDALTYVLRA